MKIVLPVEEDKQTITKKTGESAYFAIYEDRQLISIVPNRHHNGGHHNHQHNHQNLKDSDKHTHSHRKDIESLRGCDIILVQAVGENMREALEHEGLKIQKIRQKHGITANEVVQNFLDGKI